MKMKNKKFYWILPAIVLPFLCLIFFVLGGGTGAPKNGPAAAGLNPELPRPVVDARKEALDKLSSYERAGRDSMTRKKYEQRDPYPGADIPVKAPADDKKADDLLRQLNRLQEAMAQQQQPRYVPAMGSFPVQERRASSPPVQNTAPAEADPQLEKIDRMLDKVMRIQHPGESEHGGAIARPAVVGEVLPVDSMANTISVVVPEKQVLTAGATIALRLQDSVRVKGAIIPSGQMVYGVVSVNGDRMIVHISAIRSDRNIYTTDLQVFDLDGLPGIHIPGQISRDVAKQSADQGLSGLNLMNYDPSIGGQAANAGIQAAKSLFGRKVRQVKVTVKAGYRLLLRDPRASNSSYINELPGEKPGFIRSIRPPGFAPGGPSLKHFSSEGMDIDLMGIYLMDETLWFSLVMHNRTPIGYVPEYIRWYVRDRQVMKRTAVQEIALKPTCQPELRPLEGDSSRFSWTGFFPFTLSKDKQLVLEIGEKGGGRTLTLEINHKQILKTIRL